MKRTSNRYRFWFFSLLNIWKDFKVLSCFMQKWIQPPAFSYHGLHRILSFYRLAHFYLMKKSTKMLLYFWFWLQDSLLTSCSPKNNWCLIFGTRFGGKDRGLSTCKPWSKQPGGWIHFCMNRLRTWNSSQIFKIKNKIKKPIAVDVLFKTYPMVPLSCRSNLARRYLWIERRLRRLESQKHSRRSDQQKIGSTGTGIYL